VCVWVLGEGVCVWVFGGRVCVCVYLCVEGRRGTALKFNVPIANTDLQVIHTSQVDLLSHEDGI